MSILSPAQMAGYLKAAGFTGSQVVIMTAIGSAESGGDTLITHRNSDGSTDHGVWQINDHANADVFSLGDWRNPADNARMAYTIYKRQGYQAWSVFNSHAYTSHLGSAQLGAAQPATVPAATPAASTGAGTSIFGNSHTWLRVAMFVTGWMLAATALFMMGWENTPGAVKTVAKAAAKTAVKAAIAA